MDNGQHERHEGLGIEVIQTLEHVFTACDDTDTGYVKVSKFVEYMKEKAANSEIGEYMNDLTDILDPTCIDPLIDWSHCIVGLNKWISIINKRSIKTENMSPKSPHIGQFSPIKPQLIEAHGLSPKYTSTAKKSLNNRRFSLASTYSNESFETSDLSWDHSDIHTRMEELEITNKRLLEENFNLKKHLDATEDQNISVLQENDSLKVKISKCEKMIDETRQVNQGYEELKTTVLQFENIKSDLHNKLQTLERENKSLQTAITSYESKVSKLDTTIENLKDQKEQLANDLSLQKSLLNQIEDLKTSHENVIEESASKSEYFASVIAELSLANEVLKAQKTNVEHELSELKQEFSQSIMLQCHGGDVTSSEQLPRSLHQELKAEMMVDESIEQHGTSESPLHSPLKQRYSLIAKQCREKFIEKKELVISKIDEIIQGENRNSEKMDTSIVMNELNKELESFTEKITEFAQGKQDAEKRSIKLVSTIRKLRDENIALQESRDKALLKFGDLSISSLESEERLQSLTRLVDDKIGCIEGLTKEIQVLRNEHSDERLSYEEKIRELQETLGSDTHITTPRKQVHDLKTLVEDLKNINSEKTKKIYDLEDSLRVKDENFENLERKISTIELELEETRNTHRKELNDLYCLIPNHNLTSNGKISPIKFNDVSDALSSYIETTRRECNKLLGVRESPDGGPHQNDGMTNERVHENTSSADNIITRSDSVIHSLGNFSNKTFNNSISSQTFIDMVAMAKIYENYENLTQIDNNFSLENIQDFEMIPEEELPADISFAENHLCNLLEKQFNANIEINKSEFQNEFSDQFHISDTIENIYDRTNSTEVPCSTSRSSPTGQSGESSSRSESIQQTSLEKELKLESEEDCNFLNFTSPKILIESVDEGIVRTAQDSDIYCNSDNEQESVTKEADNDFSEECVDIEVAGVVNKDVDLESDEDALEQIEHEANIKSEIVSSKETDNSYESQEISLSPLTTVSQLELVSNSDCQSDSDVEKLPSKLTNLDISNIIEFDRSDMSSDSDGEITRRMSLASRRRHRLSRRNRAASEMLHKEEAEAIDIKDTKSEENTPLVKQRRIGVSAEPVRVSWSALREAFKKQNLGEEQETKEDEVETENNEPPLIVTLEDIESNNPPSVLLAENQQNSLDILPNEISDNQQEIAEPLNSNQMTSDVAVENPPQEISSSPSHEEKSPKSSLQVPPGIIFESMMDSLPLRYQVPFQEDKELERQYNNAVFSFHTDQYTLQKRLENQERARDVAESGMDKEIEKLNSAIMNFVRLHRGTEEFDDALCCLQSQTSVLRKAAMKISAQSEQHGCYQQENRQVANISIMIKYADHLRTQIAKLTEEIAEYRKRLADPERWRSALPQDRQTEGKKDGDDHKSSDDDDNNDDRKEKDQQPDDFTEKRKNRHSFSSISKTLIMANGLSKLQGSRRSQHLSAPLLKRRKRVSFGQVDYSDDVIDLTSPSTKQWEKPLQFLKDNRWLISKICVVFFLIFTLFLIIFTVFKSIEVEDRHRLIDKILDFVPHTIERKKPDE